MLTHEELQQKSPEELRQIIFLLQENLQTSTAEKHQADQIISELNRGMADLNQAQESNIQEIAKLRQQVNALLQERYGKKSEKGINPRQGLLFDEAKVGDLSTIQEVDQEISVTSFTRKKPGRRPLPQDLPREERVYDLNEAEKICPCGCALSEIGSDKSEQLDIIPAQVKVIVHVRKKYACKGCEEVIKTARLPEQPIPKSIASAGLLSHVLVSKYADHLPLYRQERIFQRMGIDIPRSTLSYWVIQSGALLAPLVQRLQSIIQDGDIAYADETTVQVLKELNRKAESQSYMWFFAGGEASQRCTVYEYHPMRGGAVAKAFFKDYTGYLHCDGYAGYDDLFCKGNIMGVGCWAHARRYFVKAQQQAKNVQGFYDQALKEIQKLYALEKLAKEQFYSPEKLHALRQEKAKPLLTALRETLERHAPQAPPDSPIGKAINYTLKQWPKLIRYLDDPRLEIDNNFSERAMKDFAIGRKNWLFSDNPEGAKAGAIIYSLIQTCKIHCVEPYAYLKYVLAEIPTTLNKNIDTLLPFNCPTDCLLKQYR